MVSRGFNSPIKNSPFPPYDDIKIFPQALGSSRFHKYNNYDKTTHNFSPYCYFLQANLLTRLFTAPQLTLNHFRQAPSLTRC